MKKTLWSSASCAFALAAFALPCAAQTTGGSFAGSNLEFVPTPGAGLHYLPPNGGIEPRVENGVPLVRPVTGKADFTTTLEFEDWKREGRVFEGNRQLVIFAYSSGLTPDSDVTVRLPIERVKVNFGAGPSRRETGLDDLELTYKRYKFDTENPNGVTLAYGLRAFAPVGDEDLPGQGQFSFGPLVSVSKPFGNTLGYLGGGYLFNFGDYQTFGGAVPVTVEYEDTPLFWVGGLTQLQPRLGLQYDLTHFKSPVDDTHLRGLLGVRYALSPTRTLQLNYRKEFQADGKPQTISVGFSSRF